MFSESVHKGFGYYALDLETHKRFAGTRSTAEFSRTLNAVFDVLNGCHSKEGITKNNREGPNGNKKK